MTDEKANKILLKLDKKNRPENFKINGKIDYELWIRTNYKEFCKRFGEKPRKNENPIITEQRESYETFIYIYDKRRTGITTVKGELGLKKRQEEYEELCRIVNEFFPFYKN